MKIAIPVDENNAKTGVCISFGRAPFFLVYDSETKDTAFIENTAAQAPGGAGIKAAQMIVDSKAEVLLTPRCGENAADVIKAGGIKMFKTIDGSAMDNVHAYIDGKLSSLDDIHPGFHRRGN
ncbi:MAG TPA: NifB/NifX family molybdenum-iron cluster-binding protein [Clostridia bacterium]|nr:NifB/NifX family molybdenum-iron cluster-binding protein [Clostridia bacterium]